MEMEEKVFANRRCVTWLTMALTITTCELLSQMSINYLSKVGSHAKEMKI